MTIESPAGQSSAGQSSAGQRHRVVVVGGGFGGLNVARELADADVDVTVVDRTNHHLFQPLLYQVAAGILSPGLIAPALRGIIKDQSNARALLADVDDLDLDAKVVHAHGPDGRPSTCPTTPWSSPRAPPHSYFGKDEFAEFAPGMKTIEDARLPARRDPAKFEMAEVATDPAERAEWLTFVVIGAGPTGVELAGQIAELAHTVLPQRLPVDRHPRGPDRPARGRALGAAAVPREAAGVRPPPAGEDGRRGARHLPRDGHGPRVDHLQGPGGVETIRARTRIWAAGVRRRRWRSCSREDRRRDRPGRPLPVNPDCTVHGHPEVFAIGDMVSLNKLPGVAQPALQEGSYVGKVIKARLAGERRQALQVLRQGLDGHHRLPVRGGRRVRDEGHRLLAYLMWAFVHVWYLIGWGNRIGTIYQWLARAGLHQEPQPPDHHVRPDEPGLRQGVSGAATCRSCRRRRARVTWTGPSPHPLAAGAARRHTA